jgi:selenide, water dikinase
MGPDALAQVLRPLKHIFDPSRHPRILVGLDADDDAAVYKITEDVAVIHTLDFFTPVVDDPYAYGAIAAANALSDVYAMGGDVLMALNICAFPSSLPADVITEILRGGAEKVAEAGAAIAGGHTVNDDEPKYGLSVLGVIHPDKICTKAGAQPGDILVLTKPLGTGMITTAAKADKAEDAHVKAAIQSMGRLNRDAARAMLKVGVHALTDITGFSLLGHGSQMAAGGNVRLHFTFGALPILDGARASAGEWLFPGGTNRNQAYYGPSVSFSPSIGREAQMLLFTPETSGGLLAAIAPAQARALHGLCKDRGIPCWTVGEVAAGKGIEVGE